MFILRGKVLRKYLTDGIECATVSLQDYVLDIPATGEIKIGDDVTLTVTPKPTGDHPLRRSTDGPAIEGTDIAVITKIEPKE